jgi:hypothetical protein
MRIGYRTVSSRDQHGEKLHDAWCALRCVFSVIRPTTYCCVQPDQLAPVEGPTG